MLSTSIGFVPLSLESYSLHPLSVTKARKSGEQSEDPEIQQGER